MIAILGSRESGLGRDEVDARLREHGPNIVRPPQAVGIATLILRQLRSPIVYLLLDDGALPFMQDVFGTAALSAQALGWATLAAAIILPAISVEKALRSRHRRRAAQDEARGCRDHQPRPLGGAAGQSP